MILDGRTRPLVIGHRGASAHAPDNTIQALELALDHGADGVEIDVRTTRDGVLILHHEPGIHDFGVFADHEFAAVRRHDPSIPTLDEAAAALGSAFINLEVKNDPRQPDHDPSHGIAQRVAGWVAAGDRRQQVMVSSFNDATVDAVRRADPAIATGQLLDRFADLPHRIDDVASRGHGWAVPYKSLLRRRGSEHVSKAHAADVLIAVWTVDGRRMLETLAEMGVDAVITNEPQRAAEVYGIA